MIAFLRGEYVGRCGQATVVDVRGVGYAVHVPASVPFEPGDQVTLHVSTLVREDAIVLYGFATATDREAFDLLLSINGVGPKTALAVLGHLSLPALRAAVVAGDVAQIAGAKGVGRKTAERLCVELAGQIDRLGRPW